MHYTRESLKALGDQSDELADRTVDELFSTGQIGHFNTVMRWFERSGQPLPESLPGVVHDYLLATAVPPDWVDWAVMEDARSFFLDNCANISTALSFASMPTCYVIPRVARLLHASHALDYPSRRMAATGQFTVYLMREDAFEAGSRFVPAAQKVRLLHASIRHHLRRSGRWDTATDGQPISQLDMIGGQMLFSLHVLDALDRLGVHMTERDAEAYYYAWRVVGAMLGCDAEATPADLPAARAYLDLYLTEHMGPSSDGAQLTRELIAMYEEVVPAALLDPIVPALIRFLIGDTAADWLEVPRSRWDALVRAVPPVLGLASRIEASGPIGEWLVSHVQQLTTGFELTSLTQGMVMHYSIPEELKPEFGVTTPRSPHRRWIPPPLTPEQT
jgi:hypothetical protein